MTAGYSRTPLWKKLGYREGIESWVYCAPANYVRMLQLPSDLAVRWRERPKRGINFVHLFVTTRSDLEKKLRSLRDTIDSAGTVWVSWPKKSSGVSTDMTEDVVRQVALPLGFADIKVCAVDETWSGLKLMIRKELR